MFEGYHIPAGKDGFELAGQNGNKNLITSLQKYRSETLLLLTPSHQSLYPEIGHFMVYSYTISATTFFFIKLYLSLVHPSSLE